MTHLWTWSGDYFGYRQDNQLWTSSGIHVGMIYDDVVYDHKGHYLGEIFRGRLIRNPQKKYFRKYPSIRYGRRVATAKLADYVGYVMYSGMEDFPEIY
ncbi:TPA: 4-fold beta flower protein [Legionella bozemanae]